MWLQPSMLNNQLKCIFLSDWKTMQWKFYDAAFQNLNILMHVDCFDSIDIILVHNVYNKLIIKINDLLLKSVGVVNMFLFFIFGSLFCSPFIRSKNVVKM